MQLIMGEIALLGIRESRQLDTIGGVGGQVLGPYRELENRADELVGLTHPRSPQSLALESAGAVHRRAGDPHLEIVIADVMQLHIAPPRQDDRVEDGPIAGGGLGCPGRFSREPALGQGAERDARLRRVCPGTGHLVANLLIQPPLSVGLATEALRMLAPLIIDIPCAPTASLAVIGAWYRLDVAVLVADDLAPAVLHATSPIALAAHIFFFPCEVIGRNPRSRARRTYSCAIRGLTPNVRATAWAGPLSKLAR